MSFLSLKQARARSPVLRARGPVIGAALILLGSAAASSQAAHLPVDTAGHTTLDQTVCARNPATSGCLPTASRNISSFYDLKLGPGESYATRELNPSAPIARSGREQRRTSLAYFSQLTDFQLADEESPARVEFLDPDTNPAPFESAWRPQEAIQPQMIDRAIHQINLLAAQSPVPQGDGSRAGMSFAISTGDSADNQQRNEVQQVVRLLEGGTLDPNSGSSNPADYANCPPGTPGPAEAAKYTGVQDYNDYFEGVDPAFYDPNDPRGTKWTNWPRYPGLMDRAEVPFQAEGLNVPSYVTLGNHDGLVQGNQSANRSFEDVATGCQKEVAPSPDVRDLPSALRNLSPAYLTNLASSDPTKVALVPPDPNRQFVSTAQYKALHGPPYANQADAHGFSFVDPAELAASNGAAAYYSWSPVPGFRFIALNTNGEGGQTNDHSSDGNIDDPQFRWLEGQLQSATDRNELIVLVGHHAINSLNNPELDEMAPPCTGHDDGHGHDTNPGCDLDPRLSFPVHLGEPSQRQPDDNTETLSELLLRYPHVIAFVAGHSHVNQVLRYSRPSGGGFWNIKTAAEADWPQQSRLIEVMDNHDGTLSIFGTAVDHASPTAGPAPGTSATNFSVSDLASLDRTLSYNDPQKGGGTGEGTAQDRNVELLVNDPREYPRPIGASPMRVSLVPALKSCNPATANASHQGPLFGQSCSPPAPSSNSVAVGGNSLGFVRMRVLGQGECAPFNPGACFPDVVLIGDITDVRAGSPTGPDYDTSDPNGRDLTAVATLPSTSGASSSAQSIQITDKNNRLDAEPTGMYDKAATVVPLPFPIPLGCTPTADSGVGSHCSVQTTANTLAPGAAVAGKRAIWEIGQIQILDQGSNGLPGDQDDQAFEVQGVFVP